MVTWILFGGGGGVTRYHALHLGKLGMGDSPADEIGR